MFACGHILTPFYIITCFKQFLQKILNAMVDCGSVDGEDYMGSELQTNLQGDFMKCQQHQPRHLPAVGQWQLTVLSYQCAVRTWVLIYVTEKGRVSHNSYLSIYIRSILSIAAHVLHMHLLRLTQQLLFMHVLEYPEVSSMLLLQILSHNAQTNIKQIQFSILVNSFFSVGRRMALI